jgi:hypothetical protein
MLHQLIRSTTIQLRANALLKGGLVGTSVGLLLAVLPLPVGVAAGGGLLAALAVGWWLGALGAQQEAAILLLHRQLGGAEYSLPLLLKPKLNIAEQLQMERLTAQATAQSRPQPRPLVAFQTLRPYLLALLLSGTLAGIVHWLKAQPQAMEAAVAQKGTSSSILRPSPFAPHPSHIATRLTVQPPAYTELPARTSAELNVSAYVGSVLRWSVQMSQPQAVRVTLVNSRGEELAFARQAGTFTYQDRLLNSGLYAIRAYWTNAPGRANIRDSLVYQSDFYRLEARPDLPPTIRPTARELYRFHRLGDPAQVRVEAQIADDFQVRGAYIVATLARGSGENVKFRETRFPVSSGAFRSAKVGHTLDLGKLGFAPGDELYYYWAALDNRIDASNRPEPQLTKSDTYFIVFKDTARTDEAELATMAVNILPEYFRSQRQIIIDTDKLIAKRKRLAQKVFNAESNEIGFDQKVLRLRYGQYLGEEFENQIGGHDPLPDNDAHLLDGYVHKHDTEKEGGGEVVKPFAFKMAQEAEQKQERAAAHGHDHGGESGPKAGQEQDPLAALMEQYVHNHDNGEVNTFYEQSTRSLLKMALEQMWQSELHLRLYEPEKARPFEQKALEYLKMAQQKARAYAKKSGYDPPPLKEKETRLTGELGDAPEQHRYARQYANVPVAALVAEVLGYVELPRLSAAQRQKVGRLSAALSGSLLRSGLGNWQVLGTLQQLAGGRAVSPTAIAQLKTKLATFRARSETGVRSGDMADKALESAFWRQLNL